MAYDEELAERVRGTMSTRDAVTEQPMFGGLAFLVGGRMAVAVSGRDGLMVRVEPAEADQLLDEPHVEPVVMRGRPTKGWLFVRADGLTDDAVIEVWVDRGAAQARGAGPKG